ncbi:hypothetical protein, partial [Magnetospirillum sp. SS-4]|uniref:hypothetical protein n=1 Tax=Magnetospirillum sp. SS-4 TaxID=2681465 RepID=UPI001C2D9DEF
MESIKAVDQSTVERIKDGDLYALLSICDNDDVDPVVATILSASTNGLEKKEKFKLHRPNLTIH